MERQPDFDPYTPPRARPPTARLARKRASLVRNISLVLLIVGFLLVLASPNRDTIGMIVGLAGVALYFYAIVLRFRGPRD